MKTLKVTHIIISLFVIYFVKNSYAQLVVQQQPAANLVTNVLMGGGVQVSNITFSGSAGAIGFFNGASTNIGLQSGILMTTGNLQVAIGPNTVENATINNNTGAPAAPIANALSAILGAAPPIFHNATTISFDFIPQGNNINFKYVFGSEEYPEFVGSEYNDVFGFFLSGPNPAGGTYNFYNMATIPGSGAPVAINSVNNGSANMGPCANCTYYINNTGGSTIQFDGFTKVLTAQATVIPCSTYKIVLALSDVGDALYESGVFLEAKSFQTNSIRVISSINSPVADGSNNLFEGCGSGVFKFIREGDITSPLTINYVVSGTANAADITPAFSGSVTFAANQTEVDVIFNAVNDGIAEGQETVTVTIIDDNPCPTSPPPTASIVINDFEPLTITAPPDTNLRCNLVEVQLTAIVTGGANNEIVWTPGNLTGSTITVSPNQTTTYTVTATEKCTNTSASDQVTITLPNFQPLTLTASNDTGICVGDTITLNAFSSGGIGNRIITWSNGATSNSITVSPSESTSYTVTVRDSCGNSLNKTIKVEVLSPSAQFTYAYIDNPTLQFFDQSTEDVIKWDWTFGDGNSSTLIDPLHHYADTGIFLVELTVENSFGCQATVRKPIRAYPPFKYYIPNTFTPEGNMINPYFNGKGEGYIQQVLLIFNRWGEKIYESKELFGRGWDGTSRGAISPIDTYVYKIQLLTPAGISHDFIGHVNLIR